MTFTKCLHTENMSFRTGNAARLVGAFIALIHNAKKPRPTTIGGRKAVVWVRNKKASVFRKWRKELMVERVLCGLSIDKNTMCRQKGWMFNGICYKIRPCDYDYDVKQGIVLV